MSGIGGSVYCALPRKIDCVLEAPKESIPCLTRVACTIGPSSRSMESLEGMLKAGMNIARFDFTYGSVDYHLESFKNLREAMQKTNTLCAVMISPAGPEIHVINREAEPIKLTAGQTVIVTNDTSAAASATVLPVNWPGSFESAGLTQGAEMFVGQYLFTGMETSSAYLQVDRVEPNRIKCIVQNSCVLEGVALTLKLGATGRNPLPCLGPEDETALAQWAAATTSSVGDAGVLGAAEFLMLPRTRSAADVEAGRALLQKLGLGHVKIVAKLEDLDGLKNHESIIGVADAVVFSRGSLGTCLEAEKVFLAQKMLLYAANNIGKPVFVTRVVDTMTDAPRPTRAEATDVANLVLDGADGVLLGSETFRGKYPIDAVRTVAGICRAAEAVFDSYAFYRSLIDQYMSHGAPTNLDRAEALASSAVRAANKMAAKLIVVFTVTGRTARLLAKFKPSQPILTVVCTDPQSAKFTDLYSAKKDNGNEGEAKGLRKVNSERLLSLQQLNSWSHGSKAKSCLIYRGSLPVMVDAPTGKTQPDLLEAILDYAKSIGLVVSGDRVVVSQCPREINSDVISEAGVVQLITVDHALV